MALIPSAPTRVQPYFGYRNRTHLVLRARTLRSPVGSFAPPDGRLSRLRAIRIMLAQFASHEVAGLPVTLTIEGPGGAILSAQAVSDREGYLTFECALDPPWALPEHPAWERARLSWTNRKGSQNAQAHILAPGLDSDLAVISDIDDTIVETGITGGWRSLARNWRRVLAQMPDERIAVPGSDIFYNALGGGQVSAPPSASDERRAASYVPATYRPFFYVSSSPWNLFSYILAFQRSKNLPLGPLLMRDWGLNRETFGASSHGTHKSMAIARILDMYPELRFALIGDDTQGDLPAFAEAVHRFDSRIAAVFVRSVAGSPLTEAEQEATRTIRAAGVKLWLGETFATGEQFLQTLGVTPGGETERIVKAVEKT